MTVKIHEEPAAAWSIKIIERLRDEGFVAYLAGGCVRDALLGMHPKDFDVATSATPETVRRLFGKRRTLAIGAAFGVINVLPPRGVEASPVEVATFRSDGDYSDGRHPDSVSFGDPQADALRRDFTINGLFFDPTTEQVIDFVGGQADLQAGLVRAIGQAEARIEEDKLRMIRAVRFAARLHFRLEASTAAAIARHASTITQTSGERIGEELRRMLSHASAADAVRLLGELQLAEAIMPRCLAASVFDPDVARLLGRRSTYRFSSTLAAMLAVACSDDPQKALGDLFVRWKLSGAERGAIQQALDGFRTLIDADRLPWSQVQPVLAGRYAEETLELAETWQHAFPRAQGDAAATGEESDAGIRLARQRLAWPREQLDPPPLIDGGTLKAMGWKPGPHFREVLSTVRAAQLDAQIHTEEEARTLAERVADREGKHRVKE